MNKIEFTIPIQLDPTALLSMATSNDKMDVTDEILGQIYQGDPVLEDIIDDTVDEIMGDDSDEEKEERIRDAFDSIDLKDYISYTGNAAVNYSEQFEAGSDVAVFDVTATFDIKKFVENNNFDKIMSDKDDR